MTELRGWSLPESHLLPDAVVAFVDEELSLGAQERAASHLARCQACAAEVTAQRQARAAVKGAQAPSMSAGFLANLRAIPEHTDTSTAPDNLAVTEDGQLVAIQRPDRVAGLRGTGAAGASRPIGNMSVAGGLGTSTPLGSAENVLGGGARLGTARRRTAQGAGVVVSGLVLSALALVVTTSVDTGERTDRPVQGPPAGVLRAKFEGVAPAPTTAPPAGASTTSVAPPAPESTGMLAGTP